MPQGVPNARGFGIRFPDIGPVALWGAALIGLLLSALYFGVVGRLVAVWWHDSDTSHGFLVPPFAAYLVWTNRERIRATKIQPSWVGVAAVSYTHLDVYKRQVHVYPLAFSAGLGGRDKGHKLFLSLAGWGSPLIKEMVARVGSLVNAQTSFSLRRVVSRYSSQAEMPTPIMIPAKSPPPAKM